MRLLSVSLLAFDRVKRDMSAAKQSFQHCECFLCDLMSLLDLNLVQVQLLIRAINIPCQSNFLLESIVQIVLDSKIKGGSSKMILVP